MDNEMPKTQPLFQLIEKTMNQVPVFKAEPNTPENQIANSRKAVLRGVFDPMATYILGNNLIKGGEVLTPEIILQTIIDQPEFKANEELAKILVERFGLNPESPKEIKWLEEEVLKISLEGSNHPLNKLAQEVTKILPEDLREVLTQISF